MWDKTTEETEEKKEKNKNIKEEWKKYSPVVMAGGVFFGVGGGGLDNTYQGRTVLDKSFELKRAVVVKNSGSLECDLQQALVFIKKDDYIITYKGKFPIDKNNSDFGVKVEKVIYSDASEIRVVEVNDFPQNRILPLKVKEGLSIYHNRDGRYFIRTGNSRKFLCSSFSLSMLKGNANISIKEIGIDKAKEFLNSEFISAVGHRTTAKVMSKILNINIPYERKMVLLGIDDELLVFQINVRLAEGLALSAEEIEKIPYKWILVKREC